MTTITRLIALMIVCLQFSTAVFAQSAKDEVVTYQIRGRVFLPDGRSAGEGVQVLLDVGSGGTREVQTDRQGKFVFDSLSPVRYTVRAHMPGFFDASESFDMSIMSSAHAALTLRPIPGRTTTAATGILQVLPSDMPDNTKDEFNAGYTVIASGKDYGKAVPHFKKVIEEYPKYAPAYMLLGTAYEEIGKEGEAIGSLQKAIELDPKLPDSYVVLGRVFNMQKKFAEAELNLTRAVELAPTSYSAQYELGRALYYQQKAPEAHSHVAAALKSNPNSADAHILLGNVMLRERNAEGALQEYKEALRLDPRNPMAPQTKQMVDKIEVALKSAKK